MERASARPEKPLARRWKRRKEAARETTRRTAEGIEANPLSVLVGGVALGVLAGALIPRTQQEGKLLGAVGKQLTDTASDAVQARRDAGKAELDALGLNRNAARDQVGKVIERRVEGAQRPAGSAAVKGSKTKDKASRRSAFTSAKFRLKDGATYSIGTRES